MTFTTDIDPGYFSTTLLEQFHAQLSRRLQHRQIKGQPTCQGTDLEEDALNTLHLNLLTAELNLRHPSSYLSFTTPILPPVAESQRPMWSPLECMEILATTESRIPCTLKPHQLWAQHKYSVMARNPALYQQLGPAVANRSIQAAELLQTLILCKRKAPDLGGLRNAAWHMWGYVKAQSLLSPEHTPLPMLFGEIQHLAVQQPSQYLLHSTALGEFAYWCWQLDTANVAPHSDSTESAC